MTWWRELVERAGLPAQSPLLMAACLAAAVVSFVLVSLSTAVAGLAAAVAALALVACLEVLRVMGNSRQASLKQLWPQIFESFHSSMAVGIGVQEQIEHLASRGPLRLRAGFAELAWQLDQGLSMGQAMQRFRSRFASRQADLLATLLLLNQNLGGVGQADTFRHTASQLRAELALHGQILAKQGWVVGSAKIALIAPWLIALLLVQLPQNQAAFGSPLGGILIFGGLALSAIAFFLVNRLGVLKLQKRVFCEA